MGKKKKKPPLPTLPDNVTLTDTHCHLDMMREKGSIADIVSRAAEYGVSRIITVGIDLSSSRLAIEIAHQFPGVYATVGVHPHNAKDLDDACYEALESLCSNEKVVAYGEIGLDFVKQYTPVDAQLEHFRRQVKLAKKVELPIVIHDREAHDEILRILKEEAPFPAGGVMHCFSGNWHLAEKMLELDFFISVPGVVTFNKADSLQEVATRVPLDKLIVETDAPFLSPVPYRGRNNRPENIIYTAEKIAELRSTSLQEIAERTSANAETLFNLQQ